MMNNVPAELPRLIAILRGIKPGEVEAIAEVLIEEGIDGIEVPLNSPDPYESIELLAKYHGNECISGAGTVLTAEQVRRVHGLGARLSVSPNANVDVIKTAADLGMVSIPGIATPSEAFSALDAGANALKLFPASMIDPSFIRQISAVLPTPIPCFPVGGIDTDQMGKWIDAGAYGFGLATNIYRPGDTAKEVRFKAAAIVSVFEASKSSEQRN